MSTRAPSAKRLCAELHITPDQARRVRALIKGDLDPEKVDATATWIDQCYHRPSDSELVMHAIDASIETHGVEGLGEIDSDWFGLYRIPKFEYCNTGDSYAATICRNNETGSYFICSWGDLAERNRI